MTGFLKERWYTIAGIGIFLAVVLLLTRFGSYFVPFLSVITITGIGFIFYMAGIRWSFHVVLLTLPFSVSIPISGENQVLFPSELLVAAMGISVVLYWLRNTTVFNEWFSQPVTILLLCFLVCNFISMFFSEMPMVSVKSVIIKTIYMISFYGGAYLYFRQPSGNYSFVGYYLLSLMIIVSIVLFRHSMFEFSKDVTGYITKPFFQDHTIYSAAVAFFLPLTILKAWRNSGFLRIIFLLCTVLMVTALFLAVSRAAWISVGAALLLWLVAKSRTPAPLLVIIFLSVFSFIYIKSDDLLFQIKANRYDSGARNSSIEEQTKSVLNITNDQSNAERLNRWKCALRMFQEKPFTGFGPGTYQFQYLSFQREEEMTRISVKSPYNIKEGKGGTAHNEFLLVLSESGIMAALFFTAAVILIFVYAFRSCYHEKINSMHLAFLFAFTTFSVHSLFNNFLDTDKTAALFYTAIAFFTVAHLRTNRHAHDAG